MPEKLEHRTRPTGCALCEKPTCWIIAPLRKPICESCINTIGHTFVPSKVQNVRHHCSHHGGKNFMVKVHTKYGNESLFQYFQDSDADCPHCGKRTFLHPESRIDMVYWNNEKLCDKPNHYVGRKLVVVGYEGPHY